jgi:hypothetical protein
MSLGLLAGRGVSLGHVLASFTFGRKNPQYVQWVASEQLPNCRCWSSSVYTFLSVSSSGRPAFESSCFQLYPLLYYGRRVISVGVPQASSLLVGSSQLGRSSVCRWRLDRYLQWWQLTWAGTGLICSVLFKHTFGPSISIAGVLSLVVLLGCRLKLSLGLVCLLVVQQAVSTVI